MPSSRNPANCLADIVENAERMDGYIAGLDQTQFELNGLVRDAVERCLERICEAAHRLGTNAEVLVPGQPWGEIRGMGNRLRHGYDRVTSAVVWETARNRLPLLKAGASRALVQLRPNDVEPN
jgi:uncharacterized protein with HEPN domain